MELTGEPGARIGLRNVRPDAFNIPAVLDQHERAILSERCHRFNWLPVSAGCLLIGYGLAQTPRRRVTLLTLGAGSLWYGARRRGAQAIPRVPDGDSSIRIEDSVVINRPPDEIYAQWHDIEKLPRIMRHVQQVRDLGNGRSRWVARAPLGKTIEWEAEVLHDDANRVISWRSVGDTRVPHVGAVHFHPDPSGKGTELRVRIEYSPPAGQFGDTVAHLFGEEPQKQVSEDLAHFKSFMEEKQAVTV